MNARCIVVWVVSPFLSYNGGVSKRVFRLNVRLGVGEWGVLLGLASRWGVSVSEVVRVLLREAAGRG